jgi:hypothetical protein
MPITLEPELEARLRSRAEDHGVTVDAYIERLLRAEQAAERKLETLLIEGLYSGDPINPGTDYWAEKQRKLEERVRNAG